MKKVDIVYFDAGSGHRSAARGLQRVLTDLHPDWRVRALNIVDVFAWNKSFHWVVQTGINYFNWCLKGERVFDLGGLVNLSLLCHDLVSDKTIGEISRFWAAEPPDAVVSVTPMYNPVLYRSARRVKRDVCCITIPVDFEEMKPRYWFTPKINQHYILATRRLEQQARAAKIPDPLLHCVPGMIIDPTFYGDPPTDIPAELVRLGLDPTLPTGLVSFGGQGSVLVAKIAKRIAQADLRVNMIFLCGRNHAVFEAVNALATPYRKLVLAYTDEPPHYYHHLADFVIGKPGSMTITEALVTRKPLVFIKSRGMRPVQAGNEAWVIENGVGVGAEIEKDLAPAIQKVLSDDTFRENARQYSHRGVFETAEVVSRLTADPINLNNSPAG